MNSMEAGIDVAKPNHDPAPSGHVPAAIVAEWPVDMFVENLLLLPDGSVLASIISRKRIERVDLVGKRFEFASFQREPTRMSLIRGEVIANVGTPGQPGWQIMAIGAEGGVWHVADVPGELFLDGSTPFRIHSILVVDSILGCGFEVDVRTRRA